MARTPLSTTVIRTLTSSAALDANRVSVAVDLAALLHAKPVHLTGLRIDDFLSLDFFLYNLTLKTGTDPVAVRTNAAKPAFLVAQFQGQAFAEQAYDFSPPETPATPPGSLAQAILAGPSRLAFRMPNLTTSLPLTLADFLDACRTWPMSLDSLAAPLPADFSDDLPTGGSFGVLTDFGSLSAAAIGSVLSGARFADIRLGLAEAVTGNKRAAMERAAGLAARPVLARIRSDLAGGVVDGAALGTFADEQVKAATTAAGLLAADRSTVRALVDLQIADHLKPVDQKRHRKDNEYADLQPK